MRTDGYEVVLHRALTEPILLEVENRDWANWTRVMQVGPLSEDEAAELAAMAEAGNKRAKPITAVRPGHADLAGSLKYGFNDVRNALDEIVQRNYFITSYMGKELTSPYFKGTVPIMSMMMALDGLHIVKIEPYDLFPELTKAYEDPKAAKKPGKLLRGAKITFTVPNSGRSHELYFFSLDATDRALQFYPEFNDWFGRNKPASALIKSASYLLHDGQFSKTREMILAAADIVVQDDTGIPLRHLKQANFNVKVFGKYHRPIKPMEWGYQKDLDVLFKETAGDRPLPFPFGYHWKGEQSGLILSTKP